MTESSTAAAFSLPVNLDMQAAESLKAALMARRGAALTVDARAVERLGGQCLQVLLAARKTWSAGAQKFKIDAMSDSFITALAGFGVAPESLNTQDEVSA